MDQQMPMKTFSLKMFIAATSPPFQCYCWYNENLFINNKCLVTFSKDRHQNSENKHTNRTGLVALCQPLKEWRCLSNKTIFISVPQENRSERMVGLWALFWNIESSITACYIFIMEHGEKMKTAIARYLCLLDLVKKKL